MEDVGRLEGVHESKVGFTNTEAGEEDGAKVGRRASALLTLVAVPPVPAVSGWSSPRPTDAFSDRAGVPPLWQLGGISVPAPTQGFVLGDLVRAHVRGIGQWQQLSPSSWGLAPRGMWLPMGDVCTRPGQLGATGQLPGPASPRSSPKILALLLGASQNEADQGSSHNDEDLTASPFHRAVEPFGASMMLRSTFYNPIFN